MSSRDRDMLASDANGGRPLVPRSGSIGVGGMNAHESVGGTTPGRPTTSGRRYIRSREGCLTCKRRKVKCDEQRPRCSHCERLNMECKWRPQTRSAAQRRLPTNDMSGSAMEQNLSPATEASPGNSVFQPAHAVDEVFDYASFMWDSGDFWQQVSPDMNQNAGLEAHMLVSLIPFQPACVETIPEDSTAVQLCVTTAREAAHSQITFPDRTAFANPFPAPSLTQSNDSQEKLPLPQGSEKLMDFFINSVNPPIIAEVETHKKWLSMRQAVVEMANTSSMVRYAILAFSNVLLSRQDGAWVMGEQNYYEHAASEVASYDGHPMVDQSPRREYLLAALFFLSYIDILDSRLEAAHSNLKRAYLLFQGSNKSSLSAAEKQLLLWIRLLDGRAVSAGGDGLFLSKDDELMLVEASPASFDGEADDISKQDADGDIEDALFQVLYQPGVVFYQKVQSFMGRISKIDPWHRSRGTVEDEIEVMNIGAAITADLRTLYDQRPPLMDYAVAGKLTEPHVSKHLAFVITRAFRTYLSNYYASKIHLHRVAYKNLPLTQEVADALDQIQKLAQQIVADLDPEDTLPVNMLWPLLMLGVETQDAGQKVWLKTQILKMEKVATNAVITAQVLEEVQARQDAAKARMDIRAVMHAVFNSCFAIV
ncbi:fungal-specific transcription factor domain-containing protein [Dactylonectria estremocensis]|uniref:Fungal-specific transcription factor domain-containing protein n=1 Tax=Dactylonectria estremocensis TaxID=1079267 RepID=A0A9P9J2Z5_9HYPO|nr:fungal-specific transcription factor domain-containing protein [Dactylonectria estremocensis]